MVFPCSHFQLFCIFDLMFSADGIGFQEGIAAVGGLVHEVVGGCLNGYDVTGSQDADVFHERFFRISGAVARGRYVDDDVEIDDIDIKKGIKSVEKCHFS